MFIYHYVYDGYQYRVLILPKKDYYTSLFMDSLYTFFKHH